MVAGSSGREADEENIEVKDEEEEVEDERRNDEEAREEESRAISNDTIHFLQRVIVSLHRTGVPTRLIPYSPCCLRRTLSIVRVELDAQYVVYGVPEDMPDHMFLHC